MTKQCYKCKKVKTLDRFYKKSSNTTDMLSGRCKKCDNILKTNWRKNNPEKVKTYERKRWRTGNKRLNDISRCKKYRDELSDSYIRELMTKKFKDLKPKDIPDDLVEFWKINLRLKRALGLTAIKPT